MRLIVNVNTDALASTMMSATCFRARDGVSICADLSPLINNLQKLNVLMLPVDTR